VLRVKNAPVGRRRSRVDVPSRISAWLNLIRRVG
jgi:hypothetical protein